MPRQTIRAGKSWTGIVKNRRKSGGFYWVRANVTPMVDRGRIVGYMSVRVKPTRQEISQAERIYAGIRAGQTGSLRISEGRIVDSSLRGIAARVANPSLRVGTWLVVGIQSALMAAAAIVNLFAHGPAAVTAI